jgi:hypothetical protein
MQVKEPCSLLNSSIHASLSRPSRVPCLTIAWLWRDISSMSMPVVVASPIDNRTSRVVTLWLKLLLSRFFFLHFTCISHRCSCLRACHGDWVDGSCGTISPWITKSPKGREVHRVNESAILWPIFNVRQMTYRNTRTYHDLCRAASLDVGRVWWANVVDATARWRSTKKLFGRHSNHALIMRIFMPYQAFEIQEWTCALEYGLAPASEWNMCEWTMSWTLFLGQKTSFVRA